MLEDRRSGVLLPLSSINGDFAVGVMGEEARRFIDKIRDMGFSYWQVLPLGTTDEMNSPYCSQSAFAGYYIYIDPRELKKLGLIDEEEVKSNIYPSSPYTADYAYAREKRLSTLKKAYAASTDEIKKEASEFARNNGYCETYAYYAALKRHFGNDCFYDWPKEYSDCESALKNKDKFREEIDFEIFVQYIFYKQWFALKEYANEKGIKILGDMPIYVSADSADVWAQPEMFKLDKKLMRPKKVAGVPPDYFSENGQKWGNPIYDWKKMKETGYKWWTQRLKFSLEIYDTVRIDHFRAFASYWEVPAEAETAKEGRWLKGPGLEFFTEIKKHIKNPSIVAEDLGTFGEDVVKLLKDTGFPGMRVIQFGFDPYGDSTHLPHNYGRNCIAYVGTHDNNTILGWLFEAREDERQFALDYCGFENGDWGEGGYHSRSCRKIINSVWASHAKLSMIAFQDMCGFGSDARMNTPGVAEGNWLYRAGSDAMENVDKEYFKKINRLYRREAR